jgi:hypothetical protein
MGIRLLLAGWVTLAAVGCGGGGGSTPAATSTPTPAPEQTVAAAKPPDDEGALAELLRRRAAELERGAPAALAATSQGAQRARDRQAARRARRVSLRQVKLALVEMQTSGDRATAKVRLRNTGDRAGDEVVQLYLAPSEPDPTRPARWLAGFAGVDAGRGESVEATVELPRRAFEIWDETTMSWSFVKGSYEIQVGRSITDRRITATINV